MLKVTEVDSPCTLVANHFTAFSRSKGLELAPYSNANGNYYLYY